MNLITLISAITALIAAITALIKILRHQQAHSAHEPVSLPHADIERAEPRDVPMGFSQPDCKA